MVALKASEASRALSKPDPRWRIWLVYGPDTGLVSERIEQIVTTALAGNEDPFGLVRLEGDDIAADPMRLADEANTIGLFGGGRVIRLSRTSRSLNEALEPLFAAPPDSALVVIETGELTPKSPLRAACERSPHAVTVPCYTDEGRGLAELVDTMLRAEGVTIERGARDTLIASLGSDRLVSRQEVQKLLLYVQGQSRIEQADVEAMVGDSAVRETDTVVDAVFSGALPVAESAWAKLRQEGLDATVIAGALQRHALMLMQARVKIEEGQSAQIVSDALRMSFTRKPAAQMALRNWTANELADVAARLSATIVQARQTSQLSAELVQRLMLQIGRKSSVRSR